LNRANYQAVLQGQQATAGVPQGLLQQYLTRGLTPINAGQSLMTSQIGNLANLGAVRNANTIYQTPEQLQAARLGLLGGYSDILNKLNIFGVGGQFPNQNFPSIPRGGGNPNGGYPYPAFQPPGAPAGGNINPQTGMPWTPQDINPSTGMPWEFSPELIPPTPPGAPPPVGPGDWNASLPYVPNPASGMWNASTGQVEP
jgi:hypothetical protein